MSKNKISEWSATASNNTDVGGIDIAEGCAPSGINNAIREMMAQIKDQQAGTDADNFTVGGNLIVNGTTTLTGSVTATAFVLAIKETVYPVGSIFTATVSTNPSALLGIGTWAAFGAGRVLVGNGGGFTAGDTGGSADAVLVSHNHTATSSSSVSDSGHTHNYATTYFAGAGGPIENGGEWRVFDSTGTTVSATTGISVSTSTSISTNGVSATNANLQPYVVVYMWQRTA